MTVSNPMSLALFLFIVKRWSQITLVISSIDEFALHYKVSKSFIGLILLPIIVSLPACLPSSLLYNVTHKIPPWWLDKCSGECTLYLYGFDISSGKCSADMRRGHDCGSLFYSNSDIFAYWSRVPAIANRCACHSAPSCDRLDVSRICFCSSFRNCCSSILLQELIMNSYWFSVTSR